jgi:hypothetical protein
MKNVSVYTMLQYIDRLENTLRIYSDKDNWTGVDTCNGAANAWEPSFSGESEGWDLAEEVLKTDPRKLHERKTTNL